MRPALRVISTDRRAVSRLPVAVPFDGPTQLVLGLPVELRVIRGGGVTPEPVALRRAA